MHVKDATAVSFVKENDVAGAPIDNAVGAVVVVDVIAGFTHDLAIGTSARKPDATMSADTTSATWRFLFIII
jgi:hypothetical protein